MKFYILALLPGSPLFLDCRYYVISHLTCQHAFPHFQLFAFLNCKPELNLFPLKLFLLRCWVTAIRKVNHIGSIRFLENFHKSLHYHLHKHKFKMNSIHPRLNSQWKVLPCRADFTSLSMASEISPFTWDISDLVPVSKWKSLGCSHPLDYSL